MDTDYLLYLRKDFEWAPWSALYMGNTPPRFLIEAEREQKAEKLFRPLKVENLEELKSLVEERKPYLQRIFRHTLGVYPLEYYDPSKIGSRK